MADSADLEASADLVALADLADSVALADLDSHSLDSPLEGDSSQGSSQDFSRLGLADFSHLRKRKKKNSFSALNYSYSIQF